MKLARVNNIVLALAIAVTLIVSINLPSSVLAAGTAVVSASAPTQLVSPGTQFTVNITIQPNNPIAGVQFSLSFNPSLVTVNGIEEGNLLNQNGASTYFIPGTINNTTGTITGVAGAIIGNGQAVSTPGTLAVITITASTIAGTCPFTLSKVIVGDTNGQSVPINMVNGQVVINGTTTTTNPPGGGGGGGGGGLGIVTVEGVTDIAGFVDDNGVVSQSVYAWSDDKKVLVYVGARTTCLNADGTPLKKISLIHMTTPPAFPAGSGGITLTYDFTSVGATFTPPVTIRCSYDPALIPPGVAETSLQIAYYDSTLSAWVPLPSTVDTMDHFISAQISHFTPYAVSYGVKAPPPAPTTTTTTTTTPTTPSTTTPTTTPTSMSTTTITPTSTPIKTTTVTTSTISAGLPTTIEPPTTPPNTPADNIPTFRLSLLAIAIGIATFMTIVTATIILLRRRNSLKRDGHLN